jgi:hypothetical protein
MGLESVVPAGVLDHQHLSRPLDRLRRERTFSGGFFLEGPAAAADGTVYFSDVTITAQSGR